MKPVTKINYEIDVDKAIIISELTREDAKPYQDQRETKRTLDNFLISRYNHPYLDRIMNDLKIKAKPRFYWLAENSVLEQHTDHDTTCAINFVLSDDPAPVNFSGVDYYYTSAILNTTCMHGVINQAEERLILKFSIFGESYEQLVERFTNKGLVVQE